MFIDVPLHDPMRGEGAGPWRLPAWLRATCRLCFGEDCAWPATRVEAELRGKRGNCETSP